ncbi:MAG: hypothetical protein ACREA9_19255, partial [Pyrinomonadaceae bacterium]
APKSMTLKVEQTHVQLRGSGTGLIRHDVKVEDAILFVRAEQNVAVEASRGLRSLVRLKSSVRY